MITAIVNYKPDSDKSIEYILERFQMVTPIFEGMPGLVAKYFGFDEEKFQGTSVYIWESKEAAEKCFSNSVFQESFKESFGEGCNPQITYVDIKHIINNR